MEVCSPCLKDLFYPPREDDDNRRVIKDMTPNVFRKIMDYLFRGRVPLTLIDDAWRVKVAGREVIVDRTLKDATKFWMSVMFGPNASV